jgi:hypothetical protein
MTRALQIQHQDVACWHSADLQRVLQEVRSREQTDVAKAGPGLGLTQLRHIDRALSLPEQTNLTPIEQTDHPSSRREQA